MKGCPIPDHTLLRGFIFLASLLLGVFFLWPRPARADAGYALQFDGSTNYVSLGGSNALFGNQSWTGAKTVSAWIKPTGVTAPTIPPTLGQMIVMADRPRIFGISRAVYQGGDRLWVTNMDANDMDTIGIDFTLGEWVHVAFVHDGLTLFAYRNGVLVGAIPSGPTAATARNDGTLFFGGSGRSDPSLYFAGELDEVRFWDTALDGPTIAAWYNRQLDDSHPSWTSLRAYYQMSDGTDTLLSDNSPNGQTGFLLGGMDDGNWIVSGAPVDEGLPTPTATETPAVTATPTNLPTETPPPPTATATLFPPTPTATTLPASEPVEVAAIDTPGYAYTVRVVDGVAYLADVTGGLRIYDVSNPAAPVELGFYLAPRRVYGVAIAGQYAYAAATEAGVRVLDVSDPTGPVEVAAFAFGGFTWAVTIHEGIAYVGDRSGALHIVDVTDPVNPTALSTVVFGSEVLGIAVAGDLAYVAAYTSGLQVVDVSDPSAPVVVGSLPFSRAYDLHLVEQHVFVADGGSGLRIVDVSNPAQPALTGSYKTGGWSRNAFVRRDHAYVGDWTSGVTIVDVADYSAPTLAGLLTMPGKPRDVWIDGNYLYVAAYEGGLRIYDIGP